MKTHISLTTKAFWLQLAIFSCTSSLIQTKPSRQQKDIRKLKSTIQHLNERLDTTEELWQEAITRATAADMLLQKANAGIAVEECFATAAQELLQEAEARATAAEERATAAEERATAAEERATAAEELARLYRSSTELLARTTITAAAFNFETVRKKLAGKSA